MHGTGELLKSGQEIWSNLPLLNKGTNRKEYSSSAIDAQTSGLAELQVDNYLQITEVPCCLYVASIHVYQ